MSVNNIRFTAPDTPNFSGANELYRLALQRQDEANKSFGALVKTYNDAQQANFNAKVQDILGKVDINDLAKARQNPHANAHMGVNLNEISEHIFNDPTIRYAGNKQDFYNQVDDYIKKQTEQATASSALQAQELQNIIAKPQASQALKQDYIYNNISAYSDYVDNRDAIESQHTALEERRQKVSDQISEYIKQKGGEDNLTEEELKAIQQIESHFYAEENSLFARGKDNLNKANVFLKNSPIPISGEEWNVALHGYKNDHAASKAAASANAYEQQNKMYELLGTKAYERLSSYMGIDTYKTNGVFDMAAFVKANADPELITLLRNPNVLAKVNEKLREANQKEQERLAREKQQNTENLFTAKGLEIKNNDVNNKREIGLKQIQADVDNNIRDNATREYVAQVGANATIYAANKKYRGEVASAQISASTQITLAQMKQQGELTKEKINYYKENTKTDTFGNALTPQGDLDIVSIENTIKEIGGAPKRSSVYNTSNAVNGVLNFNNHVAKSSGLSISGGTFKNTLDKGALSANDYKMYNAIQSTKYPEGEKIEMWDLYTKSGGKYKPTKLGDLNAAAGASLDKRAQSHRLQRRDKARADLTRISSVTGYDMSEWFRELHKIF